MTADDAGQPIPSEIFEQMVALRRDLHAHPELSGKEARTARQIQAQLDEMGIPYKSGVAGHGIIAEIAGLNQGPRVALRADMDALPIQEATGLPFASRQAGIMHACGHDGHSSILLGAAALLLRKPPPSPVRLIWQPAEEEAWGASAMIDEGALEGVGAIFGGHLDRLYEPGTLIISTGAVNASTDLFKIDVHGQQGHGARPHQALDAVVVGSLLVTALQTIVSRETDPADPAVLSVCTFHAGTAPNIIAGHAHLEGTLRTHAPETRAHLHRSLNRIATAIGDLHGASVEVEINKCTPPLINTDAMAHMARQVAARIVGEARVGVLETTNMGGEDFACYLEHVPGCYIRFGAKPQGRPNPPAHSSRFDFEEAALATGAAWMAEMAAEAGARLATGEFGA